MKLVKVLEIGKECGLETVGEAISNVRLHSPSLFSYSDIGKELLEVDIEYRALRSCTLVNDEALIDVVLSLLNDNNITVCMKCYKKGLKDSKMFGSLDESILD